MKIADWYKSRPKWVRFSLTVLWTAFTQVTAPVWLPCAMVLVGLGWAVEELIKLWERV